MNTPTISLGQELHKKIRDSFPDVSRQTIYAALKYFNNSDLAQEIRLKAKQLLKEEANNIKIKG